MKSRLWYFLFFFLLFCCTTSFNRTSAATLTWFGTTSTSWSLASNWKVGGVTSTTVPGAADNVIIGSATNAPVINSNVTILTFTMSSGSLTINSGFTLTTTAFTFSGTNTTINGPGNLNIGTSTTPVAVSLGNTTSSSRIISANVQIYTNNLSSFQGNTFQGTFNLKVYGSNAAGSGGNTFNGLTTLENKSTGTFKLCTTAPETYNGVLNLTNSSTGGMEPSCLYKGNYNNDIVLINIGSNSWNGIMFGNGGSGGISALAAGKKITVASGTYAIGTLQLKAFTQLGTSQAGTAATNSITLTGTSVLNISAGCIFAGFTASAPSISATSSTFNGLVSITRSGSSNDFWEGPNIFNDDATFTNSGTGVFQLATTIGNTYYGNATFIKSNSGAFNIAQGVNTYFYKNLTYNATLSGQTPDFLFDNIVFKGTTQTINSSNGSLGLFSLEMNQASGGTLTCNASLNLTRRWFNNAFQNAQLILTSGKLVTSTTKIIKVMSDDITITGGSASSYVEGPFSKFGSAAFKFPIGKNGKYRPIAMSAPSYDEFKAEYFEPPTTQAHNSTLGSVSSCGYWNLTRISGSSAVKLTLFWDNTQCANITNPASVLVARLVSNIWQSEGAENLVNGGSGNYSLTSPPTYSSGSFAIGFSAAGGPYTWTGQTSSDWTLPSNWSPASPAGGPKTGDDAIIVAASNSPVLNVNATYPNYTIAKLTVVSGSLTLNDNLAATALTMSGGSITIATGKALNCSAVTSITGTSTSILGGGQLNIGTSSAPVASVSIGNATAGLVINCPLTVYTNDIANLRNTVFNGILFLKNYVNCTAAIGGNTFSGATTIENASPVGVYFSKVGGADYFNNDVFIISSGTGGFYLSYLFDTRYEGNIKLKCLQTANFSGIRFGEGYTSGGIQAKSFQAAGKNLTVTNGDFSAGYLVFNNFIQETFTGTAPVNDIQLTGTSVFTLFKTNILRGNFTAVFPTWNLFTNTGGTTTFFGPTNLTMTGGGSQNIYGGLIFEDNFTFTNSGSGQIFLGYEKENIYKKNATFIKGNNAGDITVTAAGTTEFYGDLTTNSLSGNHILFPGKVAFRASIDQTIQSNTTSVDFHDVIVNKGGGILNAISNIALVGLWNSTANATDPPLLNLSNGVVKMGAGKTFTIDNNPTMSGASVNSYIDGTIVKNGNSNFIFPLGKYVGLGSSYYTPIEIFNCSVTYAVFTASYTRSSPAVAGATGLQNISNCEYWNLTANGTHQYQMRMYWSANNCTPVDYTTAAVANYNGSTWQSQGNSNATQSNISGSVASNLMNSYGVFSLVRSISSKYTVTSSAESGPGSLSEAINFANTYADFTTIKFNIPGSGVQTITTYSGLPAISTPVLIDGSSQPGYNSTTKDPLIKILDDNANVLYQGMLLNGNSAGSTIQGLYVSNFYTFGILVQVDNVTVKDNILNHLRSPSSNGVPGLGFKNAGSNSKVIGNIFGTDATGANLTLNISNGSQVGIYIYTTDATASIHDIQIGGTNPGEANKFAFQNDGIVLNGNVSKIKTSANIFTSITDAPIYMFNPASQGASIPVITNRSGNLLKGTSTAGNTVQAFISNQAGLDAIRYLGFSVADASGSWTLDLATIPGGAPVQGTFFIATATDAVGNTSMFSPVFPLPEPPKVFIDTKGADALTFTITGSGLPANTQYVSGQSGPAYDGIILLNPTPPSGTILSNILLDFPPTSRNLGFQVSFDITSSLKIRNVKAKSEGETSFVPMNNEFYLIDSVCCTGFVLRFLNPAAQTVNSSNDFTYSTNLSEGVIYNYSDNLSFKLYFPQGSVFQKLSIYDKSNALIKVLTQPNWDGKNAQSLVVEEGIYKYKIELVASGANQVYFGQMELRK